MKALVNKKILMKLLTKSIDRTRDMKESIPQKHKSMSESTQMELNLTVVRRGIKERLAGRGQLE